MATLVDSPDVVPVLPGATFLFEAAQTATTPATLGSTMFVPYTADDGPDNVVVEFDSFRQFVQKQTDSDGPARRRVLGAFLGEGLPGKGGAGKVLGWRQATAAAARASHTLQNTTPANALVVTGRWKGTRANQYALTVRPSANAGQDELVLLDGAQEVETYDYDATNISQVAASINATSKRVTAAVSPGGDGVALAHVAGVALAGGNDGDVITVGDWTAMLDALDYEPFGVFAAAGLVDPAIVATLHGWKDDLKANGKRIFLALGGPAAESFAAHQGRALGYADEDTLALGTGDIVDTALTTDGSELQLSTAEWVTRAAGAIARRGELMDMVNVRFAGVTRVVGGVNRAQANIAATSGMTVMSRDGDRDAPFKIALGVTTYTADTPEKPKWVYGNVKFVRTNHGIEQDLTEDQEHGDLIGELGVNPRAADTVLGRAKAIIKDRIARTIIQPASDVIFDPDVERSETDDFVALAYDVEYVRGLRSIRNRLTVR